MLIHCVSATPIADSAAARPAVPVVDLVRWGLAEQVRREQAMDLLLADQPLPDDMRQGLLDEDLCRRLGLAGEAERQVWMQRYGVGEADWQRMAARPWQWRRWCQEQWGPQLQTLFLQRKAELDRVTYSMLRLRDGELALELFQQIKEGEASFAELASQFSEGPERNNAGLVGPMPLSQPHPAMAKLLQVSKPGQLWPPKQLEGWWLILRLERLHPASLDGEMQERLLLEEGDKALEQLLRRQQG